MKHNIIAILVFIGFIATVFTLGYVTSRDTMPMYSGHTPQINTAGGQSVDRRSGGDGLSVSQISREPVSRATGGYGGTSVSSMHNGIGSGTTGNGLNTLSSSQTMHGYGGGSTASSAGVSNSKSSGNLLSNSGAGGIGSFSLAKNSRTPSERQAEEMGLALADGYAPTALRGDDEEWPDDWEDPFKTPVGDVPIALIITMIGTYIAIKTLRLKHD